MSSLTKSEAACVDQLFRRKHPAGTVAWWVDDGQDGGWVEWVTPEEWNRRDKEAAREDEERERRRAEWEAEDRERERRLTPPD